MSNVLVTVGVCVQLVMAVVGWMETGMEVVVCRHAGQSQGLVAYWEMPVHLPSAR